MRISSFLKSLKKGSTTLTVISILTIIMVLPKSSFGQLKISTSGYVGLGEFWGGDARRLLDVNGHSYFSCIPSPSGVYIESHTATQGEEPLLRPQWAYNGWLGTKAKPFWRVYADRIYTTGGIVYDINTDEIKENVTEITNALEKIEQLNGLTYDLPIIETEAANGKITAAQAERIGLAGFRTTELAQAYPPAVSVNPINGALATNMTSVIPLLVEAIKEQQAIIRKLEGEIESLKERISEVE
jgi:hypothetical protein